MAPATSVRSGSCSPAAFHSKGLFSLPSRWSTTSTSSLVASPSSSFNLFRLWGSVAMCSSARTDLIRSTSRLCFLLLERAVVNHRSAFSSTCGTPGSRTALHGLYCGGAFHAVLESGPLRANRLESRIFLANTQRQDLPSLVSASFANETVSLCRSGLTSSTPYACSLRAGLRRASASSQSVSGDPMGAPRSSQIW